MQSELFASGPAAPVDLAPAARQFSALSSRLPPGLRMGTSSWSFPGWDGIVWDRATTSTVLGRHGLRAYAQHPLFGCVGVDRGYYQPVPFDEMTRWVRETPESFRFVVKADRRLVFPHGPGSDPDVFMNAQWALEEVVGPALEALGRKLGALLFQFPPLSPHAVGGARRFAEDLYRFLSSLPTGAPTVVEIRTPALFTADYANALAHGGAAHGYVVHPEMESLADQAGRIPPAADRPTLIRWMLQPGYRYAEAKEAWAPFRELRRPDATSRSQVAEVVKAAVAAGSPPMVVVNNKAEGSAPLSIHELASALVGVSPPGEATD